MPTEITITLPDGPDVQRHLGEIIHHATLIGSDVNIHRVDNIPNAPIGSIPPANAFGDRELDVIAGDTMVDPTPTPAGGNRQRQRRN